MEVTQEELNLLRQQKQDRILGVKGTLLSPGDGQDGDFGVCKHKGKVLFATKVSGEWQYSEMKRAKDL